MWGPHEPLLSNPNFVATLYQGYHPDSFHILYAHFTLVSGSFSCVQVGLELRVLTWKRPHETCAVSPSPTLVVSPWLSPLQICIASSTGQPYLLIMSSYCLQSPFLEGTGSFFTTLITLEGVDVAIIGGVVVAAIITGCSIFCVPDSVRGASVIEIAIIAVTTTFTNSGSKVIIFRD